MGEKFKLSWHTFQNHTKDLYEEILSTGAHADVTLVCDDQKKLKAHKFIITSCSPVFQTILADNENVHPREHGNGIDI